MMLDVTLYRNTLVTRSARVHPWHHFPMKIKTPPNLNNNNPFTSPSEQNQSPLSVSAARWFDPSSWLLHPDSPRLIQRLPQHFASGVPLLQSRQVLFLSPPSSLDMQRLRILNRRLLLPCSRLPSHSSRSSRQMWLTHQRRDCTLSLYSVCFKHGNFTI